MAAARRCWLLVVGRRGLDAGVRRNEKICRRRRERVKNRVEMIHSGGDGASGDFFVRGDEFFQIWKNEATMRGRWRAREG